MTDGLGAVCDSFYISSRLYLKLDLSPERETVLHFFDRVRKEFPRLVRMRRRDTSTLLLEEEPDERDSRRWLRLDPRTIRMGFFNPTVLDDARRFGEFVFEQAPYHLTLSDLDIDHLELSFGFDLQYRGNHDQLVADTLMGDQAGASFLNGAHALRVIDAQPHYGVALSPDCDLQAYVDVRSRTTTFEVRSEGYEVQPITVLLTLRKYWGILPPPTSVAGLKTLFDIAECLARESVVPQFVNPLAAAINSRP